MTMRPAEQRVLAALLARPGRMVRHNALLAAIGPRATIGSLRVHLCGIRKRGVRIRNISGAGYRAILEEAAA